MDTSRIFRTVFPDGMEAAGIYEEQGYVEDLGGPAHSGENRCGL